MAIYLNQLRAEALKRLIGSMQLKQFADIYDLDASYISQILNGHRNLGEKAAASLESRLGLPALSLVYPRENLKAPPASTLSVRRIPIQGAASLEQGEHWSDLDPASGWVDIPSGDPDVYSILIRGNSISPAICDGWAIWLEPNRLPTPYDYVIVHCTNNQNIIKKVVRKSNEQTHLASLISTEQTTLASHEIIKIHPIGGLIPPSGII